MKYFAYSVILAGISCSFGAASFAASHSILAKLTCAEFMSMDVEAQRAALDILSSPERESVTPNEPQALIKSDAVAAPPDAGNEDLDSNVTDLGDANTDTELKAVLAACQGYEAAFVADRMSL